MYEITGNEKEYGMFYEHDSYQLKDYISEIEWQTMVGIGKVSVRVLNQKWREYNYALEDTIFQNQQEINSLI